MSKIDYELTLLRQRIAMLEERKRIEAEQELAMQVNPLNTISDIIAEKTGRIDRNRYSKSFPMSRIYDQEQIDMLIPILNMLKTIVARLDALESSG
jgi:uncharacterized coiled-coil protein SlyX